MTCVYLTHLHISYTNPLCKADLKFDYKSTFLCSIIKKCSSQGKITESSTVYSTIYVTRPPLFYITTTIFSQASSRTNVKFVIVNSEIRARWNDIDVSTRSDDRSDSSLNQPMSSIQILAKWNRWEMLPFFHQTTDIIISLKHHSLEY